MLWSSRQLGTPRMIFDKTGSLANTKRHDYLPFGEELYAGAGLRTTTQGYMAAGYAAADKARQKFTEQERDDETGLDFMHARYFASTQGRFTSVDPLGASARAGSPQTWNRYSYALNNPLRYNDPSGLASSGYQSGDMNGPGVGNPQDSEEEQRHRMQQFLAQQAADEADAESLEAVRNGGTATASLIVTNTYSGDSNRASDPQDTETASVNVMGGDPLAGSPQKRSDTSGDSAIKVPEVKEQPDPNRGKFDKCFEGWRFSTAVSEPFKGTSLQGPVKTAAGFLELSGPASLSGDAVATGLKASRAGIGGTKNPYASGLNLVIRRTAPSFMKGTLLKIGTRATPILSGAGAFTFGYNLTVGVGCAFRVIK
jgi:RHS repeat-associated protein